MSGSQLRRSEQRDDGVRPRERAIAFAAHKAIEARIAVRLFGANSAQHPRDAKQSLRA
jgi:hypothetical protein